MRRGARVLGLLAGVGVLTPVPVLAAAQPDRSGILEEVIVTARKREESLQDVPTAVSVLTGEELLERGVPTIEAVGQIVPNVHFEAANGTSGVRSPQVFMRGMGQSDFIIVEDPAVGVYLDGVFVGRMLGSNFDLIDVERVEVLRGPQGTLFGRNTVGGAINIVSRRPDEELGATARVTAGEKGHQEVKVSVNVPFSDDWGGRATFFSRKRDGYIEGLQYSDYDFGNEDLWGLRTQLTGMFGEQVTVDLSADYSKDTSNPSGATSVAGIGVFNGVQYGGPGEPGQFGGFWNRFWSGDATCLTAAGQANNGACYGPVWNGGGRYESNAVVTDLNGRPIEAEQDSKVWGGSMTVTVDLDWFELKSITAYREFDIFSYNDVDFAPMIVFANTHPEYSQEQFSQELQIVGDLMDGRLHYVAGAYYFSEEGTEYIYNQIAFPAAAGGSGPPTFFFQNIWRDVDNESKAIFAQVTYDITERLHLTVGDRYTDSTKDFELLTERTTSESFQYGDMNETQFTPMLSLSYDLNDASMVYFTYSEGFRDGGYPARFTGVVPNPLPNYDPEYVTNYEVGYKGDLFDGLLRANVAAFVMEYEDMQISATSSTGGQTSKANLGEATMTGLELELLAMPIDQLMLGLNIGWLDDEIDSFRGTLVSSGITIEKDNDLPYTPDWTLALTAGYEIALPGGATINLRADYSAKDKYYTAIENVVETLEEDYRLLSASVIYTTADDQWSFGLMGRNITDEDFYQSRTLFESFRMTFGQPVRPRTYSAFVEYRL